MSEWQVQCLHESRICFWIGLGILATAFLLARNVKRGVVRVRDVLGVFAVLIGVILFLIFGNPQRCGAAEAPTWSMSIDTSLNSAYVDPPSGFLLFGGANFQTTVRATHRSGAYGEVFWAASPSRGAWSDGGDEIDFHPGLTHAINTKTTVDVSYRWYHLHPLSSGGNDFHAADALITQALGATTTVSIFLEHKWATNPRVLPGGLLWMAELEQKVRQLDFKFDVGGHDGAYGASPQGLAFARGIVSWSTHAGPSFTISPVFAIQRKLGKVENPIAVNKVWGFLNLHWER